LIIRRAEQESVDRYPGVPRFAFAGADTGQTSMHVGDLSYLPGYGVPHHYHTGGAEETQIMLSGVLECWIDGKRTTVRAGDTVTAPPGTGHAFNNRNDTVARMITAFPVTGPETIHIDDPELEDVTEHSAIIRAGSRRSPFMPGLAGVERFELSGDFSGAKSTYSYLVEIQPGAAIPVHYHDHETALFVVEGPVVGVLGDESGIIFETNDGAVASPNEWHGFANEGENLARLIAIHPVINPPSTTLVN
jgi:quercetin dioxygenase-like cupin family protein